MGPYIYDEGIPTPVVREIMSLKQLNHPNITKLYDIVLNDPAQSRELSDALRKVTMVPYNKNDQQSTKWNLHLVQEFVPNELFAIMRNLKMMHIEKEKKKNNPESMSPDIGKLSDNLSATQLPAYPNWFDCANIKSIMHNLLNGLLYLQQNCYVHRDLEP